MANKPTRFYSSRQEKEVASQNNGKVVSNSGATRFDKGDVITNHFVVECKTKTEISKSVSIKKEWLDKAQEDSFSVPGIMRWALAFNFGPGTPNYYVIDERTFKEFERILDE